jgi:hypothetical protein
MFFHNSPPPKSTSVFKKIWFRDAISSLQIHAKHTNTITRVNYLNTKNQQFWKILSKK